MVDNPDRGAVQRLVLGADTYSETIRIDLGFHFLTDEYETMGYWQRGRWQATIPYWAELFGAVETEDEA